MIGRLALIALVASFGFIDPAEAAKRVRGQYGTSNQPYWQVGALDRALSAACRRGEFGQRKINVMTIGFVGPRDRGVTGIATNSWNLVDPRGLAQPNTTYHFFNEGYSNCKVYTAPIPRRTR